MAISNIKPSSTVEKVFPYYRLSFSSIHRYFWDSFCWLWSLWDFSADFRIFNYFFFHKSIWFDWILMCLIQPVFDMFKLDWSEEYGLFRALVQTKYACFTADFSFHYYCWIQIKFLEYLLCSFEFHLFSILIFLWTFQFNIVYICKNAIETNCCWWRNMRNEKWMNNENSKKKEMKQNQRIRRDTITKEWNHKLKYQNGQFPSSKRM